MQACKQFQRRNEPGKDPAYYPTVACQFRKTKARCSGHKLNCSRTTTVWQFLANNATQVRFKTEKEGPQVVHAKQDRTLHDICFHLVDVEDGFAIVLARGKSGVTALVPRGATRAELGDPSPPAQDRQRGEACW